MTYILIGQLVTYVILHSDWSLFKETRVKSSIYSHMIFLKRVETYHFDKTSHLFIVT